MTTLVIPMAGAGKRFSDVGYEDPKPFIKFAGRPMIHHVVSNLTSDLSVKVHLVVRQEHLVKYRSVLDELKTSVDLSITSIDELTRGTAETVLLGLQSLDKDQPIIIANADQIVEGGIADFYNQASGADLDGSILVFQDREMNPKWSFAKVDVDGNVVQVAEKNPISDLATVGIYYFGSARAFERCALEMIEAGDAVNNEFYVCPVYNYLISQGGLVKSYKIAPTVMHGIGTPLDLERYVSRHYSDT